MVTVVFPNSRPFWLIQHHEAEWIAVVVAKSVDNKIDGEIEPAVCLQGIPQWKLWKIATNDLTHQLRHAF